MKIIDSRNNTIELGQLKAGDLFEWKGVVYMLTNLVFNNGSKPSADAVAMECGRVVEMYLDVEVIALQGELKI